MILKVVTLVVVFITFAASIFRTNFSWMLGKKTKPNKKQGSVHPLFTLPERSSFGRVNNQPSSYCFPGAKTKGRFAFGLKLSMAVCPNRRRKTKNLGLPRCDAHRVLLVKLLSLYSLRSKRSGSSNKTILYKTSACSAYALF